MSVYVISVLDKNDLATYAEYSRRARVPLADVGGAIVVSDDAPLRIEGLLPVVASSFLGSRTTTFDRWWKSAEYQAAIPFRHAAADTKFVYKVRGFE
jgi:uncharacterized protein (DUF1330 family)